MIGDISAKPRDEKFNILPSKGIVIHKHLHCNEEGMLSDGCSLYDSEPDLEEISTENGKEKEVHLHIKTEENEDVDFSSEVLVTEFKTDEK